MTAEEKRDLLFVLGGLDPHAFGGPWGMGKVGPTGPGWGGPEPMRGYGYPSYLNPQDVQEEPNFDETFDETILRHTRASRGGTDVLGAGWARQTRYLRGTPIVGFFGLFDADYGSPATPRPYARVTPSAVSGVLLPFHCPACGRILREFSTAEARRKYTDPQRGHSWCPWCNVRFYVSDHGTPLLESLPAGAMAGPATITRSRETWTLRPSHSETVGACVAGCDALGAL